MNDTATLVLLLVAAGLLVVLGVGLGRERGRQPSRRDTALMAGMTGVTIGFLVTFLSASLLALGPIAIAGVLVATWASRRQSDLVGAFLLGAGLLVAALQALALINDIGDPAVSIPGWTPVPMALASAAAILGAALLVTDALDPR